jgi:DNA-directed RNA polymerase subunit RPC12/RpoP
MSLYKSHYACFECRKTFKRKLMWDIQRDHNDKVEAKCPQCGTLMANMGLDFAAPKKDNLKQWTHIKTLYKVGITFHSCGCSGPGYIPNSKEKLIEHFEQLIKCYQYNLTFWRQKQEPKNDKEIQREISKNWDFISQVPSDLRPKKGAIENEDAKKYWIDRIKQVEQKLVDIK